MLRAHRVLVAGGSKLPDTAVNFVKQLGKMLARDTQFILVNGGFASGTQVKAADETIAQAALEALGSDADVSSRIETVVPETEKHGRHRIGRVISVKESDTRTRRYSMVINSDAVLAFAGEKGTREIIDLAFFAKKPLILFPTFDGATKTCWEGYRNELSRRLCLTETELKLLEGSRDESALVETCHTLLLRALRPGCFVALRFESHPVPNAPEELGEAVEALGYQVVRLNKENFTGSAIEAIWHQIERSALVIADLTGGSPNVYYEVGIAHALRKPTLLLIYSQDGRVPDDLPFDVRGQQILAYSKPESLVRLLQERLPNAEHNLRGLLMR